MPLWTFLVRSLTRRRTSQVLQSTTKQQCWWPVNHQRWTSFKAASSEDRRDDRHQSPHAPPLAGHSSERRRVRRLSPNTASTSILQKRATVIRKPVIEVRRQPARYRKVQPLRVTFNLEKLANRRRRRVFDTRTADVVFRRTVRTACDQQCLPEASDTHKTLDDSKRPVRKQQSSWITQLWKHRFAEITKDPDSRFMETRLRPLGTPTLDPRVFEWTSTIIDRLDSGETLLTKDDLLMFEYEQGHEFVWTQIALWLLTYNQKQMMRFLLATHLEPYLPAIFIENSLLQLAMHWSRSDDPEAPYQLAQLAELFCALADRKDAAPLAIFNSTFKIMMRHCSDELVNRIYKAIRRHRVQILGSTCLHFARYFAWDGQFRKALDALTAARNAGANVNGPAFRRTCSVLLRKSISEPEGLRECLDTVSSIVDMGVRLNNPICDIIMLNAVEAADLNTAFSVYHSLVERGLRPTESTFMVLLKGCKMNIDDAELLNDTIRSAISHINVRRSRVVATEILHCLALHHSKHNPENALNILTEAYVELFDVSPLRKLDLRVRNLTALPLGADDQPMTPTPHAMAFMISANIMPSHSRLKDQSATLAIYKRWRQQVEAGDPLLASLATTDHVANIFLMRFIRTAAGLLHAQRVIRDMRKPLPATAGVQQCQPTVQSWSIFLHGFVQHGKKELAEQVIEYMRSKGIEPDQVTWNTLIKGYARDQDERGILDVLRRADQGGHVWDRWTYAHLGPLRNNVRVRQTLSESRLQRSLDFSEDLKQGLAKRLTEQPSQSPALIEVEPKQETVGFGDSSADLAEQSQYIPF